MDLHQQVRSLARDVVARASPVAAAPTGRRYLLGIAGIPGAGKSTLADLLAAAVNDQSATEVAVVVPMDGFHLPNHVLEARGIHHLKGVPETFDGGAYVRLLAALRQSSDAPVPCPLYDRGLHAPVPDARVVQPRHRIVITEGNYLLCDFAPWTGVSPVLDEVWFVSTPFEVTHPRLVERHVAGGRTHEEALRKIESTDLPNARLIEAARARAHRIIVLAPAGGDAPEVATKSVR